MTALAMFESLPDSLRIQPFTQPIRGSVMLPGSKSITNRAMLLAALSQEKVTLKGALFSEDSLIMSQALEALGFAIQSNVNDYSFTIKGTGGNIPNRKANIFVGTAGTAARFLVALCALQPNGEYYFDGTEAMRQRPMRGLLEALATQGCEFSFKQEAWQLPFYVKTCGLKGGIISVDASTSSQMLSALLMVAPLADTPCTIQLKSPTVSKPFVAMTLEIMRSFGASVVSPQKEAFEIAQSGPYTPPAIFLVEPDATAASYFCALVAIHGGELTLPGLSSHSCQGDAIFPQLLEPLGLQCEMQAAGWQLYSRGLQPLKRHWYLNMNAISDTFLTLAAIAPLLEAPMTIEGLRHTRLQESDRVLAMAKELERIGQCVTITEDSLKIVPAPLIPAKVHTYNDHRVVMSFGILGTYDLFKNGKNWLQIDHPAWCQKTFPNFFEVLQNSDRHIMGS